MPPCSVSATTRASQDLRYESSRNRQSVATLSPVHKGGADVGRARQKIRYRQILRAQEIRIEQFRLGARAAVGEDGDDRVARPELFREPYCAGDINAGRAAEAEAFVFQQVEDQRHGFGVLDEVCFVDDHLLDDVGHAAEPDALGDRAAFGRPHLAVREQIVHRRAARIGDADDDVLVLPFQVARYAGERAAGADRADEAVDLAVGLLPDLRTGRDVMRLAVVEVVPLVGEDHAVLLRLFQFFGEAAADVLVVVRIGKRQRGHFDELRAVETQRVLLLLALRARDNDDRAIAARIRDHRQPDAGIAGCGFDDETAGFEFAARFRFQDHLAPGTVLHRAAGIHELGFAQDRAAGRLRGALELDQRRVANRFDDAVADGHASSVIYGAREPSGGRNACQGRLVPRIFLARRNLSETTARRAARN